MADPPVPEDQKVDKVYATIFNPVFAQKAENLRPTLHAWDVKPKEVISFGLDEAAYFKSEEFVLDFGSHNVGYVSFHLGAEGVNIDAPARLRLTFGEIPYDVTEELHPCRSRISTSWLPDEVINVDWVPSDVAIPQRHAFRYLRVQIFDTSPKYKIKFSGIVTRSESAVPSDHPLEPCLVPETNDDDAKLLRRIDAVSQNTLRSCMQTVFEDGPRRDRRLWSGDLRLQALTNYCTFGDGDLVKRCVYMFAAAVRMGRCQRVCSRNRSYPATDYIVDYDVLFGSIVDDYCEATGDLDTGRELWQTVLGSTKAALAHITEEGIFSCGASSGWKFLDWAKELDRDAGMHGLVIFALKAVNRLAGRLGEAAPYGNTVARLVAAAEGGFYDEDRGVFVSGPQAQVSWASQAWTALAGVMDPATCKAAILKAMADPTAVRPMTPYLYHHVAEALSVVGGEEECLELIREYWGGMIRAGADTFWECFDPDDSRSSPYGDCHNNSYCHAWSCTPSYLLRVKLKGWLEQRSDVQPEA
ncbi:hypothetical protein HYQ46_000235 [Verticillium longisporum]|nr:hypothetical protein HYQ46_000235 [Verticillium longisporum]